jgi:hypothetical protein
MLVLDLYIGLHCRRQGISFYAHAMQEEAVRIDVSCKCSCAVSYIQSLLKTVLLSTIMSATCKQELAVTLLNFWLLIPQVKSAILSSVDIVPGATLSITGVRH